MKSESLRIVIDNNIYISVLLSKRDSFREAFLYLFDEYEIIYSDETLLELNTTLQKEKFKKYADKNEIERLINLIKKYAIKITINSKINDCRDPKDNKFLELAVDGKADYIITGDKDLLSLNPYRNIQIISIQDFKG